MSPLWHHCMAVYWGHEDVSVLAAYMKHVLGWWQDQARPFIQLCQLN
jgi:hypothetical protein